MWIMDGSGFDRSIRVSRINRGWISFFIHFSSVLRRKGDKHCIPPPNVAVQWMTFLLRNPEVPASNRSTKNRVIKLAFFVISFSPSMIIWGQYLQLGHGTSFHIFPNSLFITSLTFTAVQSVIPLRKPQTCKQASQSTFEYFDDASQNLTKLNQYEMLNLLINYKHQ